jgi:hypothetical protein
MRNGAPRHLEAPSHLRRRWTLWTGVGAAVLVVLGGAVWAGLALCLILAGAMLVRVSADRGRHLAGRSSA